MSACRIGWAMSQACQMTWSSGSTSSVTNCSTQSSWAWKSGSVSKFQLMGFLPVGFGVGDQRVSTVHALMPGAP